MSRPWRHGLLVCLVVCAALGVARAEPTRAQKLAAQQHLKQGSRLYAEGRFAEAVEELAAGYALDPRPEFLYALGQAERRRGDCKAAIGYYQRFVDSGPSPQRTVAVLTQIDRCKQELAAAPAGSAGAPPAAEPAPAASPSAAPTPPPALAAPTSPTPTPAATTPALTARAPAAAPHKTAAKPLYRRWWVWTTVAAVVVAGAGVGVGVYLSQRSTFDPTLPDLVVGKSSALVRF